MATYFHDFSDAMSFESKPPVFEVAVCGYGSLFSHTIESPAFTVRSAVSNLVPSIVTLCVAALAAFAAGLAACGRRRGAGGHGDHDQAERRDEGYESAVRKLALHGTYYLLTDAWTIFA